MSVKVDLTSVTKDSNKKTPKSSPRCCGRIVDMLENPFYTYLDPITIKCVLCQNTLCIRSHGVPQVIRKHNTTKIHISNFYNIGIIKTTEFIRAYEIQFHREVLDKMNQGESYANVKSEMEEIYGFEVFEEADYLRGGVKGIYQWLMDCKISTPFPTEYTGKRNPYQKIDQSIDEEDFVITTKGKRTRKSPLSVKVLPTKTKTQKGNKKIKFSKIVSRENTDNRKTQQKSNKINK